MLRQELATRDIAAHVMINVADTGSPDASELTVLVRENLDGLVTYATHLIGDADDAIEFVAGGVHHATKYPPARLHTDGQAALFRAVTRACRSELRYPPQGHGPVRLFRRRRPAYAAEIHAEAASRVNTVKRALMAVPFDRRSALLLRDLGRLSYRQMATALECSPEAAARLLSAARRQFGTVYREIRI